MGEWMGEWMVGVLIAKLDTFISIAVFSHKDIEANE